MKKSTCLFTILFLFFSLQIGVAQDKEIAKSKIEALQSKKPSIKNAEREALKVKVERINEQLNKGLITQEMADQQKKEAAELHAANIEDRVSVIDKSISLIQRNEGILPEDLLEKEKRFVVGLGHEYDDRYIGIFFRRKKPKKFKYDKRLYSDLVVSVGLNHAVREGAFLKNTGFSNSSSFYELGWAWRYRLLKKSNALRLNFGVLYQHNTLDIAKGLFDVNDLEKVEFYPTDGKRGYARLVSENIVLQLHLETGPSKFRETESSIRYSLRKQFRFGLGGFIGVPTELEQKLSYDPNDPVEMAEDIEAEQIQTDEVQIDKEIYYTFKTNNYVYGISGYFGIGGLLLYVKYDLSSTFSNAVVNQNNISLGLRLDM